jgi:hypothetical protein
MLPTFDTRPRGARCQQDIADMEGILHPGAEIDRRQVAIGEGRCRKGARSMARGWGRALHQVPSGQPGPNIPGEHRDKQQRGDRHVLGPQSKPGHSWGSRRYRRHAVCHMKPITPATPEGGRNYPKCSSLFSLSKTDVFETLN